MYVVAQKSTLVDSSLLKKQDLNHEALEMQWSLQSIPSPVRASKLVRHVYLVVVRSLLQKVVWEGLNAEQADALAFLIHADALRLASGTVEGAYPGRLLIKGPSQLGFGERAFNCGVCTPKSGRYTMPRLRV